MHLLEANPEVQEYTMWMPLLVSCTERTSLALVMDFHSHVENDRQEFTGTDRHITRCKLKLWKTMTFGSHLFISCSFPRRASPWPAGHTKKSKMQSTSFCVYDNRVQKTSTSSLSQIVLSSLWEFSRKFL